MTDKKVSRRGVYYDLSLSPYEYTTPYGDSFKFQSQKKLEMYTRDVEKEVHKLNKLIDKHQLSEIVPDEIIQLLTRAVYRSFYRNNFEV